MKYTIYFLFIFFFGGGGGLLSDHIFIHFICSGDIEQMLGPSLCVGKIHSTPLGKYFET